MPKKIIKKKFTDAQREKMKMVGGFNSTSIFHYVPESFKEKDDEGNLIFEKKDWMVFHIKPLSGEQFDQVRLMREQENETTVQEMARDILDECIVKVVNFYDLNGNPVEYEGSKYLSTLVFMELIRALMNNAWLSDEEKEGLLF